MRWSGLREAVRSLAKQARFTVIAVLTLALGVGASTAIFSVVHGVLLTPLPYRDGDRLVNVWSHAPKLGYDQFPLSPDLFFLYERDNRAFESMALFQTRRVNLTGESAPDVLDALVATRSYFDTLGVSLAKGRTFTIEEDAPNGPRVAVISHRAWVDRFGRDEQIVGRVIRIDGEPTEIVGLAPPELDETGSPDVILPSRLNRETPPQGSFGWSAFARLRPGVTADAATEQLKPIVQQMADGLQSATYRAFIRDGGYEPRVNLMRDDLVGTLERPLWILLGTVGMLLLIACANVANLFLVRAEGRQREMAVRSALGASRAAIVRHVMTEAVVLAVAGAAIGVAAAAIAVPALLAMAPPSIPRLDRVAIAWPVLAFAGGAALLSALVFGLWPAIRSTRPGMLSALKHGGRGGTEEPARRRARQALVVVQTAMALVLLVGSGLLVRSFSRLVSTDLGFDPRDAMTFRVALPPSEYGEPAAIGAFVERLVTRLGDVPGVESVGAASVLPIANAANGTAHAFEGQPIAADGLPPIVHFKAVARDYFEAMRIPLRRGRLFHSGDLASGTHMAIVNEALAAQYWPGEDAIGKRLRLAPGQNAGAAGTPWITVVGLVGDERQDGLRRPIRPLVYYPIHSELPAGVPAAMSYVVRGPGIETRADALREAVWDVDRNLPVASMRPMTEIVGDSIVQFTFTMVTLGIAAGMALLLGAIGLYGVLSYTVSQRTREIGVRMALGAPPSQVLRSVMLNGVLVAGIGLAIGLAAAAGVTRFLGTMLFETPAFDMATFAAAAAALLLVALVASFLPARRAAAVDPMESMRTE